MRYPNLGYSPLYILIRKLIAKITKNHTGVPCTRAEWAEIDSLNAGHNAKTMLSQDMEMIMNKLEVNPWAKFEDKVDNEVPSATLGIYKFIEQYLERSPDNNVLRASAATMCVKRRQYKFQGAPETPLTPRKMVNFLLGDLTERTLLYWIKSALVGPGKLYSQVDFGDVIGSISFQGKPIDIYVQKSLIFSHPAGFVVSGHADGFGKRNSDGQWELIEIKSSSDWGFKSFQDEGPGDYLKQSHALMMTDEAKKLGVKQVRFFYLKKQTGHIWDGLYDFDESTARLVADEFQASVGKDEIAIQFELKKETYYKKETGRMVAQFPCTYCPYLELCQGPYELEFKSGKPIHVFKRSK